ncbi:MAG TPA: hypothetical protein ENN35_03325, partial [Deltaproteobacteria bacterium]|nr:hypothetical protein [Deltaproteobacteria bacterium]
YHPAVLRALKKIVQSFERHGKEISLCGEQAHDVDYLPFLAGIGIRTLSVDPRCIPAVQRALVEGTLEEWVHHTESLLAEKTVEGVLNLVRDYRQSHYLPLDSHGSCQVRAGIPEEPV